MLKILINEKEIDFDGRISLRLLNPIFHDQSSYSFNIKTSNTPRNKDIIDQLHLPEIGYNNISFTSQIITDAFIFKGAVYFNSVTGKYIDFQFTSQNDFWSRANVDLHSIHIPFEATYFPVKNTKFFDKFPIYPDYSGFINAIDETGNPVTDESTAPVPFFKMNHIVNSIFNHFDLDVIKNELEESADISQLYLYNNNSNGNYGFKGGLGFWVYFIVTIESSKYKLYAPFQHGLADKSYILLHSGYMRPVEAFDQLAGKVFQISVQDESTITLDDVEPVVESLEEGSDGYFMRPVYLGKINELTSNHLPEISATEFLKEIEKVTASRVFVDESSNSVRVFHIKNILNSNESMDISNYCEKAKEQVIKKYDGYKLSFKTPRDDYYTTRIKEPTELVTIKPPVQSYENLPIIGNTPNDLRLVLDENVYYRFYEINFLKSSGWEFYSENNLSMQAGNGKFKIETEFSPVLTEKINGKIFSRVDKEGTFLCMNESTHDDFRLFFHRGDFNGIPLCTSDVYDNNGNKIPSANLSIRWDGEYGLYNQLYKEYIDLMINKYREEKRFINWPAWFLNSFPWWKKFRIHHINYLVSSIDLDIDARNITFNDTVMLPV